MLNSEKMVASIGNQDLDHADKYFKKAFVSLPNFFFFFFITSFIH